jgi:[ribosomal protein S18]-alanine N-acetyltransferase
MIRLEPLSAISIKVFGALLSDLHRTCFPDDPWPPQTFAELGAMAGIFGRIAWEDAGAAGLALVQGLGEEGELLTLGVIPERRRSGIGSALLAAIVAEARGQGLRALFLEVAQDNSAGRALYAAHGFVQIGRRANYYRRPSGLADALVLRHLLST